jgi:CheY-like chemotaxis protein
MAAKPQVLIAVSSAAFGGRLVEALRPAFEPQIETGASALEASKKAAPQAVVLSQLLSGMDGVKLTQRMKEAKPIPVVLLGAVSSPAGLNDVRKASGADVVLPGSCTTEDVVAALTRLLFPPPPRKRDGPALPPEPIPVPVPQPISQAPAAPLPVLDVGKDLAWILSRAFLDRVTGSLRFSAGGAERVVYFDRGQPTVVISNVPEERLGTVLVRKEKITEAELEEALNYSEKKQVRLLEVLVTMALLSKEDKAVEVAQHYVERLFALFARPQWDIDFRAESAPREDVVIQERAPWLIAEGLRRHYELPRLQALIDPNRVLRPGPNFTEGVAAMALRPGETEILRFLDGTRNISQACEAAGQTAEAPSFADSLRTLHASTCLDLLA